MRRLLLIGIALLGTEASGQSLTTGAVAGRVTDKESGEPLAGITVTIGSQTVITDEDGAYKVTDLVPGSYDVHLEFDTASTTREGIVVSASTLTTLNETISIGEIVIIKDQPPPPIALDSTAKERRIDRDQLTSLPVPGTSFEDAAGAVPGAQNDGVGIAMSGSSGLENRYLLDGTDITGLTYGNVGTPVLNEFIHEIAVVSGGYSAEYGRSTGGIVNVITRSGTDELRGSVFGLLRPGALSARRQVAPSNVSTIDITGDSAYSGHFGFELGGPIVKKALWFYVGVAPQAARTDYTRRVTRRTDCRQTNPDGSLTSCASEHADGVPDLDPATGFYLTDVIDRETRSATTRSAQIRTKLRYALSPNDQAQLSVLTLPTSSRSPGLTGPAASGSRSSGLTTDVSARWSSKLRDGGTEIEGIATWHRATTRNGSFDPRYDRTPLEVVFNSDLAQLGALGAESAATALGCADAAASGAVDPYPLITNCPVDIYSTELEHGFDLHVGYKRELHDGVHAELFIDIFNLYNRQGTFRVDDTYAPQFSLSSGGGGGVMQNVNPISGGTYADLVFAKAIDRNGVESATPLGRNPNFGNTTARYAPAAAQLGFRVTF